MASVTRHDDKWRGHVFKHGTRASKVFPTKREAQAWAIRKESELDSLASSGGKTLRTVITHYLKTVSPEKKGATEWESRRFDTMASYFGEDTPLAKIDSAWVGRWRDWRLETVGGSTVQREANLLRHLFTLSCDEWRLIDRNPFKGVRLPKEAEARHQLWRWQQIKAVLRAGQRSGGKTQQVTQAFHIALRTGMRLQEVLSAPAHLDVASKVVTVPTKTTSRPDQIPVGRIAVKLLQAAVFTVSPNEASTLFSKLTKRLIIEDLTFHDARATALTLLAKKVDVMVLARISRHKDINLLHRVYYRTTAADIAAPL